MSEPVGVLKLDQDSRGVATLTVNRPEALNALNSAVLTGIHAAIRSLPATTRAIIVRGAGPKAFVAGADIAEMANYSPAEAEKFSRIGQAAFQALQDFPAPVIAVVQGFALGGGLELALACDVIISSDKGRFGLPESTLAVVPGFGGTQRLSRRLGPNRAKKLLFSGEMVGAQSAYELGIVDLVVPAEELESATETYLAKVLANGPKSNAAAKQLVDSGYNLELADGIDLEAKAFGKIFGTKDQKEGMSAFLAKRKPEFRGE